MMEPSKVEGKGSVIRRDFYVSMLLCGILACSSNGGGASGGAGGGGNGGGEGGAGASGGAGGNGNGGAGGGGGACDPNAGTYFVSKSGNDANAGTAAAPFATISRALDIVAPGETIVVDEGVYPEVLEFQTSGASRAPITLRAQCGKRPILDGAGKGGGGEVGLISIVDQSYITVEGFEIRGLEGTAGNFPSGIWVRGSSHDIRILNNIVHHISAENGGDGTGAHGIAVYGTKTTPAERIEIAGNEVHDLILGFSEALVVNGNVRDFEVRDNIVHHVNNIAFVFIGFESDVCGACSQDDVLDTSNVNRARSGFVHGNTAHDVSSFGNPAYGTEKAAGCFYVDGGGQILIEHNIAYACDLGVEVASEWAFKSAQEILVRNNFLYANDVTCISTGGYDSGNGPGGGAAKNCLFTNNTLFDCAKNGWANTGILLQNRNQNNVYQNNIIVAAAGTSAISEGGSLNSANVFDYNIYFGGGLDGVTDGSHSLTVDPALVNAASGDLHISPQSPAKNAGNDALSVGTVDIDGQPRKNGVVDIGADEL